VAAAYVALPGWLAVIEQVPTETNATFAAEIVQTTGVLETNVTGKPELAVALRANGGLPSVRLLNPLKVIVCASLPRGREFPSPPRYRLARASARE